MEDVMGEIALPDLAAELGITRSSLFRYAKTHGFIMKKVMQPDRRNQRTLMFSEEEAERLRTKRHAEGFIPLIEKRKKIILDTDVMDILIDIAELEGYEVTSKNLSYCLFLILAKYKETHH
jgi:hypothetical protein